MKQFAICLGVVVILLLNVMEVSSVGGSHLLDKPCLSAISKMFVYILLTVCMVGGYGGLSESGLLP